MTAVLWLAVAIAATSPPQPRAHSKRISVPHELVRVEDGDTFVVAWPEGDEIVRVLGVDAPETQHPTHDIPYAQAFGPEARAFALGALAAAARIELLRASTLDPYGRTLGYLFVGGRNYSVLIVQAHLADEDVSRYGDNGFPKEAAEVVSAARKAGPSPFDSPAAYRERMRALTRWRKEHRETSP